MFLPLETFASIIRTGLPIMVELINLVISNDLTQMVNFPNGTPDCDSRSPALLDLCLLTLVFVCSTMPFRPLGKSDHLDVSVFINFPSNSQQVPPFHLIDYDYLRADWDGLRDHLRDHSWSYL